MLRYVAPMFVILIKMALALGFGMIILTLL